MPNLHLGFKGFWISLGLKNVLISFSYVNTPKDTLSAERRAVLRQPVVAPEWVLQAGPVHGVAGSESSLLWAQTREKLKGDSQRKAYPNFSEEFPHSCHSSMNAVFLANTREQKINK